MRHDARSILVQADARQIPLADESVHMVVTSPPYWSLRDYGLPASTWGGDDQCQHEWGGLLKVHKGGPHGNGVMIDGSRSVIEAQAKCKDIVAGCFCQKCGAWLGCLGLEPTPELFVEHIVGICREIGRVLRSDGTFWLNLGDCYSSGGNGGGGAFMEARKGRGWWDKSNKHGWRSPPAGLKHKDLVGIPWRVAFALQADGWTLRDCIVWHKPNPMPSSVTDRTTTAHEYVFLLTKGPRYFYDADAIREPVTSTGGAGFGKQNHSVDGSGAHSRKLASPEERNHPLGRNKRSVWTVPTQSFHGAHFATFPRRLIEPMVRAGTSERGCCPACGSSWRRVIERLTTNRSNAALAGTAIEGKGHPSRQVRPGHDIRNGPTTTAVTTHWLPSCKCPAHNPVPCVVLDAFSGTATTGTVCADLGRSYLGVERKFEYVQMGGQRLAEHAVKSHRTKPRARPAQGDLDLFAHIAEGK